MYLPEPTEEILERICDAGWNKEDTKDIVFTDIYTHNACNHTYSGTIMVSGIKHAFVIESGDRNGTVVKQWGDPDKVTEFDHGPPPEPRTFIPKDSALSVNSPALFKVYAMWRTQEWFMEKERSYNYDRYFQPGSQIETHYSDWASKKGLKTGYLSHLTPAELAIINSTKK